MQSIMTRKMRLTIIAVTLCLILCLTTASGSRYRSLYKSVPTEEDQNGNGSGSKKTVHRSQLDRIHDEYRYLKNRKFAAFAKCLEEVSNAPMDGPKDSFFEYKMAGYANVAWSFEHGCYLDDEERRSDDDEDENSRTEKRNFEESMLRYTTNAELAHVDVQVWKGAEDRENFMTLVAPLVEVLIKEVVVLGASLTAPSASLVEDFVRFRKLVDFAVTSCKKELDSVREAYVLDKFATAIVATVARQTECSSFSQSFRFVEAKQELCTLLSEWRVSFGPRMSEVIEHGSFSAVKVREMVKNPDVMVKYIKQMTEEDNGFTLLTTYLGVLSMRRKKDLRQSPSLAASLAAMTHSHSSLETSISSGSALTSLPDQSIDGGLTGLGTYVDPMGQLFPVTAFGYALNEPQAGDGVHSMFAVPNNPARGLAKIVTSGIDGSSEIAGQSSGFGGQPLGFGGQSMGLSGQQLLSSGKPVGGFDRSSSNQTLTDKSASPINRQGMHIVSQGSQAAVVPGISGPGVGGDLDRSEVGDGRLLEQGRGPTQGRTPTHDRGSSSTPAFVKRSPTLEGTPPRHFRRAVTSDGLGYPFQNQHLTSIGAGGCYTLQFGSVPSNCYNGDMEIVDSSRVGLAPKDGGFAPKDGGVLPNVGDCWPSLIAFGPQTGGLQKRNPDHEDGLGDPRDLMTPCVFGQAEPLGGGDDQDPKGLVRASSLPLSDRSASQNYLERSTSQPLLERSNSQNLLERTTSLLDTRRRGSGGSIASSRPRGCSMDSENISMGSAVSGDGIAVFIAEVEVEPLRAFCELQRTRIAAFSKDRIASEAYDYAKRVGVLHTLSEHAEAGAEYHRRLQTASRQSSLTSRDTSANHLSNSALGWSMGMPGPISRGVSAVSVESPKRLTGNRVPMSPSGGNLIVPKLHTAQSFVDELGVYDYADRGKQVMKLVSNLPVQSLVVQAWPGPGYLEGAYVSNVPGLLGAEGSQLSRTVSIRPENSMSSAHENSMSSAHENSVGIKPENSLSTRPEDTLSNPVPPTMRFGQTSLKGLFDRIDPVGELSAGFYPDAFGVESNTLRGGSSSFAQGSNGSGLGSNGSGLGSQGSLLRGPGKKAGDGVAFKPIQESVGLSAKPGQGVESISSHVGLPAHANSVSQGLILKPTKQAFGRSHVDGQSTRRGAQWGLATRTGSLGEYHVDSSVMGESSTLEADESGLLEPSKPGYRSEAVREFDDPFQRVHQLYNGVGDRIDLGVGGDLLLAENDLHLEESDLHLEENDLHLLRRGAGSASCTSTARSVIEAELAELVAHPPAVISQTFFNGLNPEAPEDMHSVAERLTYMRYLTLLKNDGAMRFMYGFVVSVDTLDGKMTKQEVDYANLFLDRMKWASAVAEFQEAIAKNSDDEPRSIIGVGLYESGEGQTLEDSQVAVHGEADVHGEGPGHGEEHDNPNAADLSNGVNVIISKALQSSLTNDQKSKSLHDDPKAKSLHDAGKSLHLGKERSLGRGQNRDRGDDDMAISSEDGNSIRSRCSPATEVALEDQEGLEESELNSIQSRCSPISEQAQNQEGQVDQEGLGDQDGLGGLESQGCLEEANSIKSRASPPTENGDEDRSRDCDEGEQSGHYDDDEEDGDDEDDGDDDDTGSASDSDSDSDSDSIPSPLEMMARRLAGAIRQVQSADAYEDVTFKLLDHEREISSLRSDLTNQIVMDVLHTFTVVREARVKVVEFVSLLSKSLQILFQYSDFRKRLAVFSAVVYELETMEEQSRMGSTKFLNLNLDSIREGLAAQADPVARGSACPMFSTKAGHAPLV